MNLWYTFPGLEGKQKVKTPLGVIFWVLYMLVILGFPSIVIFVISRFVDAPFHLWLLLAIPCQILWLFFTVERY